MGTTRQTRRAAVKPGAPKAARTPDRRKVAAPEARGPAVDAEERRHLAESCAFFQAERYREASPATIRESDVDIAQEQLEDVLKHVKRP